MPAQFLFYKSQYSDGREQLTIKKEVLAKSLFLHTLLASNIKEESTLSIGCPQIVPIFQSKIKERKCLF